MRLEIREFKHRRFLLLHPTDEAEAAILDTLGGDEAKIEGFLKWTDGFDVYVRVEITGAPPISAKPERCRACPQQVFWLPSEATDKPAPIDATASPEGNIFLTSAGKYKVLTGDALVEAQKDAAEGKTRLYKNHFSTCPKADEFKKPKDRK